LISLPYDASLMFDDPATTEKIKWPVTASELKSAMNSQICGVLDQAGKSENDLHRSALLMSLTTFSPIWAYCEKALCVQHEIDTGSRFDSTSYIFPFLRGQLSSLGDIGAISNSVTSPIPPRHPLIRSAINTSRMVPWWKFPLAMTSATDQVGTTNHLLEDYSLSVRGSRRYCDANRMLLDIRLASQTMEDRETEELVIDQIEQIILQSVELDQPLAERLGALVRLHLVPIVKLLVQDLLAVRRSPVIPASYWGGTGGKYPSRLISLETLRRGGNVVRFDHGGTLGFLKLPEIFSAVELSVANKYVMATPRHAELADYVEVRELIEPVHDVSFAGGTGYSHIRNLIHTKSTEWNKRPRVMYLSSFSNSDAKNGTHYLPQIIYQDWSFRLAKMLSTLPIDLICKPHPDFRYPGTRHPLSAFSEVNYQPFEDVIGEADVFIFDCLNSTTFWEAVCTDKRVVCIDIGLPGPTNGSRPLFERRCKNIQTRSDEDNRLWIEKQALEEAIFASDLNNSPDEFCDILIG
jgi:hypothetical protein